jgi:hypothetical protein
MSYACGTELAKARLHAVGAAALALLALELTL